MNRENFWATMACLAFIAVIALGWHKLDAIAKKTKAAKARNTELKIKLAYYTGYLHSFETICPTCEPSQAFMNEMLCGADEYLIEKTGK